MQSIVRTTALATLVLGLGAHAWADESRGEVLALTAAKVMTCQVDEAGVPTADAVLNNGIVIVRDGLIESVLPKGSALPDGAVLVDYGDVWITPGMIDLHTHVAGVGINDSVFQSNSGLRVNDTIEPGRAELMRALAAGVTTHLYIPGSGTNIGGVGMLIKTAPQTFEAMVVREAGSLKVAQADNPKRWAYGMNRIMLNWTIREVFERGVTYGNEWQAFEAGTGPEPERNIQFDIFRELVAKRTPISAHTQVHQVVLASIKIMADEFGLDLFIDHGTFDGYLATDEALKHNVAGIIGPRAVNNQNKGRGIDTDGQIVGVAGEYQKRGMVKVGFNTDAPVVPAEELPLQAAMGVRYGFDDSSMQALLGLTIVPAQVAGIADRVGSLEPCKHADLVVIAGHPADPRSMVECVYVQGELVYNAEEGRLF